MSPTMQLASPATYTPTTDALERHEYGVSKNRKPASTGGGRAWSDDEEVYLLQTRLQKMPYKHIASHLKKTELACRLHYHQLSHGSNRRKRTTSISSGSSADGHSPILPAAMPSPINEHSPTPSPPGSSGSYGSVSGGVQLPSIMSATANPCNTASSPRLPTILPKPISMTLALAAGSPTATRGYLAHATASLPPPHSAPLLPAATFTAPTPTSNTAPPHSAAASSSTPNLRLDCTGLPSVPSPSAGLHHPVDMSRLMSIYLAHRAPFWTAISSEYGPGSSPDVLEQAWRTAGHSSGGGNQQTATPLTPGTSPDDRDVFYGVKGSQDKTRISAILGIDANPRSPKEREMVRRLESERVAVPPVA